MARSRRTPAMLVGRCSSELSGHRPQLKLKKSQPPTAAEGSAVLSTSRQCCSSKVNCHPACPGVPWDRSVPRFPTSRTRQGHVCGFP